MRSITCVDNTKDSIYAHNPQISVAFESPFHKNWFFLLIAIDSSQSTNYISLNDLIFFMILIITATKATTT